MYEYSSIFCREIDFKQIILKLCMSERVIVLTDTLFSAGRGTIWECVCTCINFKFINTCSDACMRPVSGEKLDDIQQVSFSTARRLCIDFEQQSGKSNWSAQLNSVVGGGHTTLSQQHNGTAIQWSLEAADRNQQTDACTTGVQLATCSGEPSTLITYSM